MQLHARTVPSSVETPHRAGEGGRYMGEEGVEGREGWGNICEGMLFFFSEMSFRCQLNDKFDPDDDWMDRGVLGRLWRV